MTRARPARRRLVSIIERIPTPRPDSSCGVALTDRGVELGDLAPVDHVPERVQVVRAAVLVLQVVGVLPHVGAQQRRLAGRHRVVLVRRARHRQARAIVDQPRPAGAELVHAGVLELGLEVGEGAERGVDRLRQRAVGLTAAVGGQPLPEQAVVVVAAAVVADRLLLVGRQRIEALEHVLDRLAVPLGARKCRVHLVHIRLMVLVVMDLHRLRVDMGLERVVRVRQIRDGVWHCGLQGLAVFEPLDAAFYHPAPDSFVSLGLRAHMTRLSQYLLPTEKQAPADAEALSHKLLVRAGLVRQVGAGLWSWLPAGWRVHQRVVQIVREEIDAIGGQEMLMPVLNPAELWQRSGRYYSIKDELFRLKDRRGADMVLALTHEEVVTMHVAQVVRSYRDLPLILYHFQTKERDEARPRAGVLRTREFIMKDSYTFDRDAEGLEARYDLHRQAYDRIFDRAGLEWYRVESDVGMMGGTGAHEYMAPCP